MHKLACVVTTIGTADAFFERYYHHFTESGHLSDVRLVVVTDLKTPAEIVERARQYAGLDVTILDVAAQKEFLEVVPALGAIVPFNSDNRRNVGYLYACAGGADVIVSLDDDNYPGTEDFVEAHARCGTTRRLDAVSSRTGWHNVLADARTSNGSLLYPRGFPHARRHVEEHAEWRTTEGFVAINAGLWVHDPDVDAITRIDNPARILDYEGMDRDRAAGIGTFITINSQNTAVHRSVIPAYYFIPQGFVVNGMAIDRFGDIWQGFFAKKCADAMGHYVAYGRPICRHERNRHNLFDDLSQELRAIECTGYLTEFLEAVTLEGRDYAAIYDDLADKLEAYFRERHPKYAAMMDRIAHCMRVWTAACRLVLGSAIA